jgi:autotransporter-associated beta strand protein
MKKIYPITLRIAIFLIFIFGQFAIVSGQTTYTWTGTAGDGLWTTSTNWSPTRSTPASTDIMIINNGGSFTISDLPTTQTIGKLQISGNTSVVLRPAEGANGTLTVSTATSDALTVASGSTLTITGRDAATDRNLTVVTANSTGLQAHISGTLRVALDNAQVNAYGLFTRAGTNATTYFDGGGTYEHAVNSGTVPGATWATTSLCNITGTTSLKPDIPSGQSFGNFTWHCASQSTNIELAGVLTAINGNFNVESTGSYGLFLGNSQSSNLAVGGNYTQSGGTFAIGPISSSYSRTMAVSGNFIFTSGTFYISPSNGTGTLDVTGNFSSSGTFNFTFTNYNAVATLNVTGNCSITGGTFNMSAASSAVGTLNVNGDFTHTAGTITETSTAFGSVIFKRAGIQTFTSGGSVSGTINFTVNDGSILQMAAEGTIVSGGGTFTVSNGGTLGITSTNGITAGASASGNIQTSGRVYSSGANYIYNGTSNQVTGDGLTENIPANLTINNSAGATLSAQTEISGLLTMTSGTLDMANKNLTVGSLTGSSNITNSTGTAADVVLTVGSDNTSPALYSGVISNGTSTSAALTKTGTGTLILSGTNTYTGATSISAGILQLGSGTCIPDNSGIILNGGTLSTGASSGYTETVGTLELQDNSAIALSSGVHSIIFAASQGKTWADGVTLTITGWSGTPGSSGSAGKIFVGSDINGLLEGQLTKISFYGYGNTAGLLSTGEVIPLTIPTIIISSPDPSVPAGTILQSTSNNVIYRFDNSVTTTDAVISGLQITTNGTYSASDLTNLKAWYSSDASFNSGTDTPLSTKTSSLGAGTHVFPGWINQEISTGTTGYIFITADIPCTAAAGSTIYVGAVAASDVTFLAGNKSGTAFAGGAQTVQEVVPVNVTDPSASIGVAESILSWTNPNCFDEIMIVGKAGSAVTGPPTGDGLGYTGNLIFGTGSSFEGGYVVYKGSISPQTVTGLSNGTTYYYTFFTRKGTTWTSGITVSATTILTQDLIYRSSTTGNWGDASTWQISYDNGASWIAAKSGPDYLNDQINILSGHTVTTLTDVTVDQVVIVSGGKVTVNNSVLTIVDGAGDDFTVNGTMELTGNLGTITTAGNLVFNSGGTFNYNRNGSFTSGIPTATWASTSNCIVTGVTTTVPLVSTFAQTFGNFTWYCTAQSAAIDLAGQLVAISGNFTVNSTGSSGLQLSRNQNCELTVGGNYSQSGGGFGIGPYLSSNSNKMTVNGNFSCGNGTFYISPANGAGTLDVNGNFNSAGTFNFTFTGFAATATLNVTGNTTIYGGNFNMSAVASTTGILNVKGNFSHTAGTITAFSSGSGSIVFNGTNIQTYTSGGTVSNTINFTVNSGAYLQMAATGTVISGGGTFTLSDGGTLGITSADGITADPGTATGNIRTTTGRVFNTGANFIYNGTSAQATGTGLPGTVNSLTFNNTAGAVTFNSACIVTNNFSITSGSVANLVAFTHSAGTLTLGGVGQLVGSYGSTSSGADYKNDTYFAPTTGIVNNGSADGTWLGGTTDWFTASNWSGGVPTTSTNATIISSVTNQPVITGSTAAVCNNMTINSGASLTVDNSTYGFTAEGTLSNSGTFTINSTGKATVASLTNNGTLNLNSDASGIASLLVESTSPITGTNNIQLHLTGGGAPSAYKWHYISLPVPGVSVDDIILGRSNFDLAKYNEGLVTTSQDDGWVASDGYVYYTQLTIPNLFFSAMDLGKGYAYYYGSDQLYTINGSINSNAVSVSLDYDTGNSHNIDIIGFNLIGNPFTCTLDWDVVATYNGLPKTEVTSAIYFTKDYTIIPTYIPGTGGTDGGTNLIPPMQAFFVDARASGQSITLPVTAKTHSTTARFKGETESVPLVRLLLEDGESWRDAIVSFNEKAELSFDNSFDAYKLSKSLGTMNLWTRLSNIDYAINCVPFPETSIEIPVGIHAGNEGTFTLRSNELKGLDNYSVTLKDKTTNIVVDLKKEGKLSFSTSAGEFEDRFVLIVTNITTGSEEVTLPENAFNIYAFNGILNIVPLSDAWNEKQGSVIITDLTGKRILDNRNIEFWKNTLIQLPVSGAKGIYIVEIRSGAMRYAGKVMIR